MWGAFLLARSYDRGSKTAKFTVMATLPLTHLLPGHAAMMFPVFPFTPLMLTPFTFTMLAIVTVAIAVTGHGS